MYVYAYIGKTINKFVTKKVENSADFLSLLNLSTEVWWDYWTKKRITSFLNNPFQFLKTVTKQQKLMQSAKNRF